MKIYFLIFLLSLVLAKDNPKYDTLYRKSSVINLKQEQYWFEQVLDHYDYNAKTNK